MQKAWLDFCLEKVIEWISPHFPKKKEMDVFLSKEKGLGSSIGFLLFRTVLEQNEKQPECFHQWEKMF